MATTDHLGINCLALLRSVKIKQKVTYFDNNKYLVVAPDGTVLLYAMENSGGLKRFMGGKDRSFEIKIFDAQNTEVVRLRRPHTCGPDKMDVTVCGTLVSVVREKMTFLKPVLNINDASDRPLLRVKGPMAAMGSNPNFRLLDMKKQEVGVIAKRWGGFGREMFYVNNYEITFPPDASVGIKAAIIGTCILIDFLYFEH